MGVCQFDISGTELSETNDRNNLCYSVMLGIYEGWNFNSGKSLFTTDTK